jgi:hypothetical protein
MVVGRCVRDVARTEASGQELLLRRPGLGRSTGTQVRTVVAGGIRSGKVRYVLSGWLGGFDGQSDHATLVLTFEKADGTVIGSVLHLT